MGIEYGLSKLNKNGKKTLEAHSILVEDVNACGFSDSEIKKKNKGLDPAVPVEPIKNKRMKGPRHVCAACGAC